MTEFWAYPGARWLALGLIVVLCVVCLIQARRFVNKI